MRPLSGLAERLVAYGRVMKVFLDVEYWRFWLDFIH